MTELYYGCGSQDQFDEYIDFINYVFGFNGNEEDFKRLLPKLFQSDWNPMPGTYLVTDHDRIKAAVGVYEGEVTAGGMTLRTAGIGNVAVHPYERSKGYMKKLMHMAVDDMIRNQIDYSFLSGIRQRYNYFSFEKAGVCYYFGLDKTNIRHVFGDVKAPYQMKMVEADDDAALDTIEKLIRSKSYVPERRRKDLHRILCSWYARPFIFLDGERIAGYCVINENEVTEILAEQDEDFMKIIRTIAAEKNEITVLLPDYLTTYKEALENVAEQIRVGSGVMFSVFCYQRVIQAFMKLKAGYTVMPDGTFTVRIHGRAREEILTITVKNQEMTVTESMAEPMTELSHLEAMRFFFAPICEKRRQMPSFVQCWFPLPLWIYAADNV